MTGGGEHERAHWSSDAAGAWQYYTRPSASPTDYSTHTHSLTHIHIQTHTYVLAIALSIHTHTFTSTVSQQRQWNGPICVEWRAD